MERKLVSEKASDYVAWACSDCGWVIPLPKFADDEDRPPADVTHEFTVHDCEQHPKQAA